MHITKRGRRMAVALSTSLAALTVTAPLVAQAHAGQAPLIWSTCTGKGLGPRQECATVPVPLDYRDPGGRQITLAVSRIRTAEPERRRGVLLLIPGGPGEPGLNRPSAVVAKLPKAVRDSYDIVGFDPRGTGRSAPVDCGLDHRDLSMTTLRPWPAPDGGITADIAEARHVADACLRNAGPVLDAISSINEARDIDRVRQALGERRLSAWAVSYGTYPGALYATMYPRHTDR